MPFWRQRRKRMFPSGLSVVSWATLAFGSMFVTGCDSTTTGDYRPVRKLTEIPPVSEPADEQKTASQPKMIHLADVVVMPPVDDLASPPVSAIAPVNVVDGTDVRALMNIPNVGPTNSPSLNATSTSAPVIGETVPATPKAPATSSSSEPRSIELLVKDKSFRTEPKTGALRVSFDDLDLLKVLNMEPVVEKADQLMPAWLSGLSGKRVRLHGFMFPPHDSEGIEHFVLARDNQICCFGRDPKIYDLVAVNMKAGTSTHYIPATQAFDVVGTFRIEMVWDDGKPWGLYTIEEASVIER